MHQLDENLRSLPLNNMRSVHLSFHIRKNLHNENGSLNSPIVPKDWSNARSTSTGLLVIRRCTTEMNKAVCSIWAPCHWNRYINDGRGNTNFNIFSVAVSMKLDRLVFMKPTIRLDSNHYYHFNGSTICGFVKPYSTDRCYTLFQYARAKLPHVMSWISPEGRRGGPQA